MITAQINKPVTPMMAHGHTHGKTAITVLDGTQQHERQRFEGRCGEADRLDIETHTYMYCHIIISLLNLNRTALYCIHCGFSWAILGVTYLCALGKNIELKLRFRRRFK